MLKQTPIERIEEYQKFGSVLGLDRMTQLMKALGDPQDKLRVLHVTGTNGKGSVCRFLYEVLSESGYRVGLFTSPFLEDFAERIEMNGEYISPSDLEKTTDRVLAVADKLVAQGMDSPTEFEIVTAIAFVYFQQMEPDFVILEVGLGGLGDSTNVVKKPLVTMITSVGHDHMERLGETLPLIAEQKAGILKQGVPGVVQVSDPDAAKVIARIAYEKGSPLVDATRLTPIGLTPTTWGSRFSIQIEGHVYKDIEISMAGEHQVKNAVTALAAIEILRKNSIIKVNLDGVQSGMRKAKMKGRFEVIGSNPCFILDGAHNREGVEALVHAVDRHLFGKRILWVLGILQDKEIQVMLDCIAAYTSGTGHFICTEPDSPRKYPADDLCRQLKKRGCACTSEPRIQGALALAKEKSAHYDAVLFTGSLYMIGEIRKGLHNGTKQSEQNEEKSPPVL